MYRYLKELYRFLKHIIQSRELLVTLVRNDFKRDYLGSYLGLVWAFIQPLTFIMIIWFVFTYGFRTAPVSGGTPFILWLMCAMLPWFFISEALTSGTNAVVINSFLVKKVAFRVSILPIVQILSSLIIHLGLMLVLVCMFFLYGYTPSIYWIQLPYYILCAVLFTLGISWITSAIRVFVRDVSNLIAVIIQIGFWGTPIFWNIKMIPHNYQWLFKLNPAYYITQGYRDTFIGHTWFYDNGYLSLCFIFFTLSILVVGSLTFKRLRPHFGDVL